MQSIYPIRWSSLQSFWKDPDDWYQKFYLGIDNESKTNKYLIFGSMADESFQGPNPIAPVTQLPVKQQRMTAKLGKEIILSGTLDGWDPDKKILLDHKTGTVAWTQKRADQHEQFHMYGLLKYLTEGIDPSKITFLIEWIPTVESGDFSIQLKKPVKVHQFYTKRSILQILNFGNKITQTVAEMKKYVEKRSLQLNTG